MSAADSTVTAAGVSESFCALRDTAVTSSLTSSSRLRSYQRCVLGTRSKAQHQGRYEEAVGKIEWCWGLSIDDAREHNIARPDC
jgi:hypothetical protein